MALTEAQIEDLFSKLTSHAKSLGIFEAVQGHEVIDAPRGLTVSFWPNDYSPASSGLVSTSMALEMLVRVYHNTNSKPLDAVEVRVLYAVSQLMDAYNGDFSLGDTLRSIDILGDEESGMHATWGWLDLGDDGMYRVATITLPLIINDVYEQVS